MRQPLFFVVIFFAMVCNIALAQEADVETLVARMQPEIQGQIKRTYDAFLRAQRPDEKTACEAFEELERLKNITKDKGELVEQLAIFTATTESEEDLHVMLVAMMLNFLELPPSVPIRVFAPYLDIDNRQLRGLVGMWFHNHDSDDRTHGRSPLGSVNYHDYMEYVRNRLVRNEEIPPAFIQYIYERHPGRALLVFAYANRQAVGAAQLAIIGKHREAVRQGRESELHAIRQEKRQQEIRQQQAKEEQSEILLAEHIVSNAIWLKENQFAERFQEALPEANEELAKLAKHEEWWARLYVAYIMRQHPELRQADILQQLTSDSHPLVSKAARLQVTQQNP